MLITRSVAGDSHFIYSDQIKTSHFAGSGKSGTFVDDFELSKVSDFGADDDEQTVAEGVTDRASMLSSSACGMTPSGSMDLPERASETPSSPKDTVQHTFNSICQGIFQAEAQSSLSFLSSSKTATVAVSGFRGRFHRASGCHPEACVSFRSCQRTYCGLLRCGHIGISQKKKVEAREEQFAKDPFVFGS